MEERRESKECTSLSEDESKPMIGYRVGEHPGVGTYKCITCREDWTVTIKDDHEELPPCMKCGQDEHVRYERISGPKPL